MTNEPNEVKEDVSQVRDGKDALKRSLEPKPVRGHALVDKEGISTVRMLECDIKDVQLMHGGEIIEVEIRPVSQPVEEKISDNLCEATFVRAYPETFLKRMKELQAECERLTASKCQAQVKYLEVKGERDQLRFSLEVCRKALETISTVAEGNPVWTVSYINKFAEKALQSSSTTPSRPPREKADKSFMVDCPPLNPFKTTQPKKEVDLKQLQKCADEARERVSGYSEEKRKELEAQARARNVRTNEQFTPAVKTDVPSQIPLSVRSEAEEVRELSAELALFWYSCTKLHISPFGNGFFLHEGDFVSKGIGATPLAAIRSAIS